MKNQMPEGFAAKAKALSNRIFQNHLQDMSQGVIRPPDNFASVLKYIMLSDKRIIDVIATVCIQIGELTTSFEKMQKSIDRMNQHLEVISKLEAADENKTVDLGEWRERSNGAIPK